MVGGSTASPVHRRMESFFLEKAPEKSSLEPDHSVVGVLWAAQEWKVLGQTQVRVPHQYHLFLATAAAEGGVICGRGWDCAT